MDWSLRRVTLRTHDLELAADFFGRLLGLGPALRVDDREIAIGEALRLRRPGAALGRGGGEVLGPVGARCLALGIAGVDALARRLDAAGLPWIEAPAVAHGAPALLTLDPAQNLLAFVEGVAAGAGGPGWLLHHVNLEARDVREAVGFYAGLVGLAEGRWRAPAERGDFSIDPAELAVLPLDEDNSGLHVIRPDPGFAFRNGFAHNPSIGGHPAFCVPDVGAVKARLEAAGYLVTDAGVYAMVGMRQIYVLDPSANMIEVNQRV
jgi:catechol 2,3-dioxygenase-like lactoylglutathione lyase family enzyme